MFTSDEREQIRTALVIAARSDSRISGAAHLGSAALNSQDRWSDIDLGLSVLPDADLDEVIADWTDRLYRQYGAVTHCDVKRGTTLYRVFLLRNTLQVDISFWLASDFRAIGPKFRLIFGQANQAQPAGSPTGSDLIGMAWLYALHVRSAIARDRLLQAEYMLAGMRNETFALACLRLGFSSVQGRGFDDLSDEQKSTFAACYPASLQPVELCRAFQETIGALLIEIRHADEELAKEIEDPLAEIATTTRSAIF